MTAVTALPGRLGHTSDWQVTTYVSIERKHTRETDDNSWFRNVGSGAELSFTFVRTMTNLLLDVFGGAFAILLVAASLLFIAAVDWLCAAGLGRRQVSRLRGLLFLSTAVAACGVFLVLDPGANYSDAVLRPRGLCPFAQSGKIWSC